MKHSRSAGRLFTIFSIFVFNSILFAQTVVTGTVLDHSTKKPIPFTSIGIKGTSYGTLSDENGVFSLSIKKFNLDDTLKVAAIGYKTKGIAMSQASGISNAAIELSPSTVQLKEVVVKPGKIMRKVLGNRKYNKNVYCDFTGDEGNYLGAEAAIKANNKKGRLVWIEDFNFYLMKNEFQDSVTFRLNFYSESADGMPHENILRKPIVFKTIVKHGVVTVNLLPYNITANDDFFISLECLEENMQPSLLSFSGSITGPSFFKYASFIQWERLPIIGLDFNFTVSYRK